MTNQERHVLAKQIAERWSCTVEEAVRALLQCGDDEVRAVHYLRFKSSVK